MCLGARAICNVYCNVCTTTRAVKIVKDFFLKCQRLMDLHVSY